MKGAAFHFYLSFAFLLGVCDVPAVVASDTIGPSNPVPNFSAAKKLARDQVCADHRSTLYCDCEFTPNPTGTGGKIRTKA